MNSQSDTEERCILEFIAREDGTALDTVTGLTWCRHLVGQEWQRRKATGEPKEVSLDEVLAEIERFNKRNIGSFADWRLPTQEELSVILDSNKKIVSNNQNSEVVLTPCPSKNLWTNSAHLVQNQSIEMIVGYYGGKVARAQFTRKYARLVRG